MTAICEDPCFSVCKVRLWGRIYCDGFQFFYRHYITQEIVAGELVATGRVQRQETDMVEFELSPDEYIAVVQGREGCWTNALELVTSMGRCFRVGGHGSSAFQRKVKLSHEVRGLSHKMHSFRDELCMIVPVWKALPDSEVLELAIRTVESAYQQIEVHQAFCVDLMETFSLVANKIKHFQSRGLIVPNIQGFRELSTDVAQVFEYFTSHVRRTHQAESFVRKTKQSVVETMAETIRVTSDAIEQLVQSNAPKAWDHERVLVVIELAIQSEQFVCVSSLLARHCKPLSDVFDEYGGKIIQELVKRGELLALQNLVRARGEVTDEPVPRVLAEYASQSRSLVETAVQHERLSVLEWLMFEGRMNPFEHGDDIPVMFLAQQVTNKQVRDRMELLLTQAKNRREFEQAAIAFAVSDASAVPLQSLLELVPKMTSTNDLQVLHTVGKARLQQEDFKTLLLHACNQLMVIGMATDAPGGPMPGLSEAMLHCQQPQKRDRNLSSESSSGEESWCLLAGEAI